MICKFNILQILAEKRELYLILKHKEQKWRKSFLLKPANSGMINMYCMYSMD